MKKKERRKIREFAKGEYWEILSTEGKVKFCEMVMQSRQYSKKEKKEIIRILSRTE